jgi:DNA-binding XRE family transcriptional regulator
MTNPIKATRQALKLSKTDFALALGVGYANLLAHETGSPTKIQPKMAAGLESLGLDAQQLADDYQAWRTERARALVSEVRGRA